MSQKLVSIDYNMLDEYNVNDYTISKISSINFDEINEIFDTITPDSSLSSSVDDSDETFSDELVESAIVPQKANMNEIFKELIRNQLVNVPIQWKLQINDMKRICKYIKNSIFDGTQCCIWTGYVTNVNNKNKGTYVNFYFKNKKVALHRLLYSNFISPLQPDEYIKFSCDNKGICCNIRHYKKYTYVTGDVKKYQVNKTDKNSIENFTQHDSSDSLTVKFD